MESILYDILLCWVSVRGLCQSNFLNKNWTKVCVHEILAERRKKLNG